MAADAAWRVYQTGRLVAYARQISDHRRVSGGDSAMSRLYAIEASYTTKPRF